MTFGEALHSVHNRLTTVVMLFAAFLASGVLARGNTGLISNKWGLISTEWSLIRKEWSLIIKK